MSGLVGNPFLLTSAGAAGYQISRSLRFNSADSAFLSRTPASAGNRKTWTWSGWVKRSALGTAQNVFGNFSSIGIQGAGLRFDATDQLSFFDFSSASPPNWQLVTSAVFRDVSAWFHLVAVLDTTNATADNRVRLYINGIEQTVFSTRINPSLNYDGFINNTNLFGIGRGGSYAADYFSGYLADIHFIDGQALTPSSFTEVSATTGQLIPKKYTGTFGTNGFWLQFADNSNNTATTLGKDTSSNGNNWTPNNFSVTNSTVNYSAGLVAYNSAVGTRTVLDPNNAFDGSLSTYSNGDYATSPGQSDYILCNFSPALTGVTSVRVWNWDGDTGGTQPVTVTINGQGSGVTGTNGAYMRWYDMTSFLGGTTLSQVKVQCGAIGGAVVWRTNFFAIEVNGVILQNTTPAGNDSLVDTPTSYGTDTGAGGEVRGNYATLNPLDTGGGSFANGNLEWTFLSGTSVNVRGTMAFPVTGKWYFECVSVGAGNQSYGITSANTALTGVPGSRTVMYADNGLKYVDGTGSAYGSTYAAGDVVGVAYNADLNQITFYKNNVSQGAISTNAGTTYFPFISGFNSSSILNFGQRPFAYTAPSGFKALCDTNLPAPVVAKPNTVMDVALYTGNGSTQTISGLGFSPDLVWLRNRSQASNWVQFDTVRGALNRLCSNLTVAEASLANSLTSFDSTGFTYGSEGSGNNNGDAFAAFCWDAGSSTVTNTQGSITSQVRANASAGFSVVTWTGNGTAGATVGHGLGAKPFLRIIKRRDAASTIGWMTFHESAPSSYFTLNSTNAATPASEAAPTSSVFSLPADANSNASGGTYVAYCFAPVAGYSAFGSYTGNGSADGPFVYIGFRPRWILIKNASSAVDWELVDTARDTSNGPQNNRLQPNSSAAEAAGYTLFDTLSNGFKVRSSTSNWNGNTNTIIYAAFAENPFQYARAR